MASTIKPFREAEKAISRSKLASKLVKWLLSKTTLAPSETPDNQSAKQNGGD